MSRSKSRSKSLIKSVSVSKPGSLNQLTTTPIDIADASKSASEVKQINKSNDSRTKIKIGNIREKNKLNFQSKVINSNNNDSEITNKASLKNEEQSKPTESDIKNKNDENKEIITVLEKDKHATSSTDKQAITSDKSITNRSKSTRKKSSDTQNEKASSNATKKVKDATTPEKEKNVSKNQANESAEKDLNKYNMKNDSTITLKRSSKSETKKEIRQKNEDHKAEDKRQSNSTQQDYSTQNESFGKSVYKSNESLTTAETTHQEVYKSRTELSNNDNDNNKVSSTKRKHRDSYNIENTGSSSHNRSSSRYHRSNSKESIYKDSMNRSNARSYDHTKYEDAMTFKNPMQYRYPRYYIKHQGFRTNYNVYRHNYPYGPHYANNEYSNELLFHNQASMMETEILTDDEKVEENDGILQNNESEFFISSSSSSLNQNQQKKINSKIVDMLDIDWSILNNNNKSSTKNSANSFERVFSPSFILSTIGTINECLDEKMKEKVKDFTEKEKDSKIVNNKNVNDSYLHGLSFLKSKIENGTVNNYDSFKTSPGISMRNDIERRKALYFQQINTHFENLLLQKKSSDESLNVDPLLAADNNFSTNNDIFLVDESHFNFYQSALELLKDDDN